MSASKIISIMIVVMMAVVPVSLFCNDLSSAENTWDEGNLAGYYKTTVAIDDNELYKTLLYTTSFSGLEFGQALKEVGSDTFRNINEEYGLCTEVTASAMNDGSITNISGTTKAVRTVYDPGQLFTESSPYSGELIQKINEHFGTVGVDDQITVYDEFNDRTSFVKSVTFYTAKDGYIYKDTKQTVRVCDNFRLDISIGDLSASLYSSVELFYECTELYTYSKAIVPTEESPSTCTKTVTLKLLSSSSDVYGYVDNVKYSAEYDVSKVLEIGTKDYEDTPVIKFTSVSPHLNASTEKVSDPDTLNYFATALSCTTSSYYSFVKEKVDAQVAIPPEEKPFDIMDIINSNEFRIAVIIIAIIISIYVLYRIFFYIKHRWY